MTRLEWEKASRKGLEAAARREAWDASRKPIRPGVRGSLEPTPKQLAYLRALCDQLGRDYTKPTNRRAARDEIARLQALAAAKQDPTT